MSDPKTKCTRCKGSGTIECPQYRGMKEGPEQVFHTIRIKGWKQIHKHRDTLEGKGWIFRGQGDSSKPLESSLRRQCEHFPERVGDPEKAEILLLREFRRRFHHYSSYTPREDDCLEWLSLMQHHGAPTRLLDFTYSIYIAAYFALEKPEDDYVIWAINAIWAEKESKNMFGKQSVERSFLDQLINETTVKLFPNVFMRAKPKRPKTFACPINPLRLTERLTIQKGIFMCPGNITRTFEENLCALKGYQRQENCVKYILELNKDQRRKALEELYDLNISSATLFPGLDGFARSLSVSPPKFLLPMKDVGYLRCEAKRR